jgi:hypothetical protein
MRVAGGDAVRFVFKLVCTFSLIVCALLLIRPASMAQVSARLSGQVTDSGNVIPNATVELKDERLGLTRRITTNQSGEFVIAVPPGKYELTVIVSGFAAYVKRDIVVGVGEARTLNIDLSLPERGAAASMGGGGGTRYSRMRSTTEQVELTWNTWVEPNSASTNFQPLKFLEPDGKSYSLVIDLAAFAYRNGEDVYTKAIGDKLKDWLLKADVPDTKLKLLIIPDANYFHALDEEEQVRPLTIDLKHLKQVMDKKWLQVGDDPFEILKKDSKAEFSFGRVSVKLRTKSREGVGSVAVVLWADGIIPVDEFSIPICVARDEQAFKGCSNNSTLNDSLSGTGPIRAATQQHAYALRPDAALTFIQLDSKSTVGVFRDNSWPADKYVHWLLEETPSEVRKTLQEILPRFDRAINDDELLGLGTELYNLLFPSREKAAKDARAEFTNFVRAHLGDEDPSRPPSIFVRMLSKDVAETPFLIPLGLMAYEIDGTRDFIGFHFRIQTPLPEQDYRPSTQCISKWVVFAPPSGVSEIPKEMTEARSRFSNWFKDWQFVEMDKITAFEKWISANDGEENPVALFILAHQNSDSLYFIDGQTVGAGRIQRNFKVPSVAIVNGCETGAPGSSKIVQNLNRRGISSIIATTAKVDRYLAGDFFSVLGQLMAEDHKGREYPLGLALFQTLKRLKVMLPPESEKVPYADYKKVPYGARVLAYQLYGNSNLQVCSPPKK